jgi:signal transduction histidine kinase
MQVSTKITFGMVLAGLLLFGGYSLLHLRQQERDLRASVERETSLLGRSLQVSLENALRDHQLRDVQQLLEELEKIYPAMDVFVYGPDGAIQAESSDDEPSKFPRMPFPFAEDGRPTVQWDNGTPEGRMLLAWPLRYEGGQKAGTLVVARPLTTLHHHLEATRRGAVVTLIAFVIATALLGMALGQIFVRRPLGQIVLAMASLRSGGSTEQLPAPHNEIGAVAQEFNALVVSLREAQEKLASETEARRQLEQGLAGVDKLVRVGQLSAGLAHEIGSPLQILSGRARALANAPGDPVRVRKNAEMLVAQTERIAQIVEQLLAFARRRPVQFARVDVAAIVGSVIGLLELEARQRKMKLRFSAAAGLPPVLADAGKLQQVVLNLVTNAFNASSAGGEVSVAVAPVALPNAAPGVRITVKDAGCGMSEEVLAQLFEPFFTTRVSTGGTGLGLAVVKSIVTEHGGQISVQSHPDRGSRFTVDLPLDGPQAERALA